MSEHFDGPNASVTTVSRLYLDTALVEARRRATELANETICGSEIAPQFGDAQQQSAIGPFPDARAL